MRKKPRPFPLFSREAERPRFAYFFRYSRGVMPKCALNARLKQERFSNLQREAMVGTVLLCFLQKRWFSHVCFLLMIGLYHNLHCLGKILHVLCGIS